MNDETDKIEKAEVQQTERQISFQQKAEAMDKKAAETKGPASWLYRQTAKLYRLGAK